MISTFTYFKLKRITVFLSCFYSNNFNDQANKLAFQSHLFPKDLFWLTLAKFIKRLDAFLACIRKKRRLHSFVQKQSCNLTRWSQATVCFEKKCFSRYRVLMYPKRRGLFTWSNWLRKVSLSVWVNVCLSSASLPASCKQTLLLLTASSKITQTR